MPQILTFTEATNEPDPDNIHIIKEKIVAFQQDVNRDNARAIFTDGSVSFLVRETLDEIYNAINGHVENNPTSDFI